MASRSIGLLDLPSSAPLLGRDTIRVPRCWRRCGAPPTFARGQGGAVGTLAPASRPWSGSVTRGLRALHERGDAGQHFGWRSSFGEQRHDGRPTARARDAPARSPAICGCSPLMICAHPPWLTLHFSGLDAGTGAAGGDPLGQQNRSFACRTAEFRRGAHYPWSLRQRLACHPRCG